MFNNIYKNKKVVVTGHTGFKGTWLTIWLLKLGAKVIGISDKIPTNPSMFDELNITKSIVDKRIDIRNLEEIKKIILETEPDFLFHLAAQPIVSESYTDPIETISTNVLGTANILESLRFLKNKCISVIITSDKCYDNVEWIWGYKESDNLGGKDIYSGSKGAAELIFKSYYNSFFINLKNIRIGSARAGNVIGGGDWAKDRIVPDCMKAWKENRYVEIRSPKATRPWQHVLEPLSGYLLLAEKLAIDETLNGESFNFGPNAEYNITVKKLIADLSLYWNFTHIDDAFKITDNIIFHEASLLKLNCEKAQFNLKWKPALKYNQTIEFVSNWYYSFYQKKQNMFDYTLEQIDKFEKFAIEKEIIWAN